MGFRHLPERIDAVDQGYQFSRIKRFQQGRELVSGTHGRPYDLLILEEEPFELHWNKGAGRCSAGGQPSTDSQCQQALIPSGLAYIFEDHIRPPAGGDGFDLFPPGFQFGVQNVIRSQSSGFLAFFFSTSRGDDLAAQFFADLDRH